MNGIKLGFNFVDFARKTGRGIGTVCLEDGSSVKILTNPRKSYSVDFFHVKNGMLLDACGVRGKAEDIGAKLQELEKHQVLGEDVFAEFGKSLDIVR